MDFSKTDKKLGWYGPIWYPASSCRANGSGSLYYVGSAGGYWSVSPNDIGAFSLCFGNEGYINPADSNSRAYGQSVRCLQE